jgi:hypothetical protein
MNSQDPLLNEKRRSETVEWRMRWYPRAVVGAMGVALLLGVMLGSGASTVSGRLGGDYPAFYGAGRIVAAGDWAHLYDPNRQSEAQRDLYPGEQEGEYLYFSYPPYVAGAYAPLALLPYRISFLLHALLMAGAVAATIWIAGGRIPLVGRHRMIALALALLFYPLLRAIVGGQNSALTLLLVVASWRLATDRRDVSAGLVLSLLLFKPQYAVPLILLYALAGRWRVLLGSALGAGGLYLIGASVMGIDWLSSWWGQVQEFVGLDIPVNGMNNISLIGFVANLANSTQAVVLLGFVPALVTVVLLALGWWKGHPDALTEKVAVAAIGVILISPHTLYYDGALMLITLVVIEAHVSPSPWRITIVWVASAVQILADVLGWSPFFFIVVGIGAWAIHVLAPALFGRASPLCPGALPSSERVP